MLNKEKQWVDAPPIPGTLVIKYLFPSFHAYLRSPVLVFSLGDQLARWTSPSLPYLPFMPAA